MQIKPIILSGGSGTRLWPISRKTTPKQFVDIFNSGTNLFEQTLKRVQNNFFSNPIIISNKEQRFDVLKSIRNNNKPSVGFEDGRNALLIANAAYESNKQKKTILLFLIANRGINQVL